MNKDEILAKSRKENENGDEMEKEVRQKAFAMSAAAGGLICMLAIISERIFFKHNTTIIWLIYAGMNFTNALSGVIQMKSKKYIGLSCLFGLLTICFLVLYITENIEG